MFGIGLVLMMERKDALWFFGALRQNQADFIERQDGRTKRLFQRLFQKFAKPLPRLLISVFSIPVGAEYGEGMRRAAV